MIYRNTTDIVIDNAFLAINGILKHTPVYVKLEGLSISGSIKVKSAIRMIARLELEGRLKPGMRVIESSSGNLGIALSMVCATKGYPFICVSDPNISLQSASLIKAYGAQLIVIEKKDSNGGFLGSRLELIRKMLSEDPNLIWINQYENINNVEAHYNTTGPEIIKEFPNPDVLFVGAGTTGTLGGVSRYVREYSPKTRIIAVDASGSVTFNRPPGKRYIPGLGTSCPPPIRERSIFDELVMIEEKDAIEMCHKLGERGILLGGSSGSVLAAVAKLADKLPENGCIIAISPDMGDRYVDTVYNQAWVTQKFGNMDAWSQAKLLKAS